MLWVKWPGLDRCDTWPLSLVSSILASCALQRKGRPAWKKGLLALPQRACLGLLRRGEVGYLTAGSCELDPELE